MPRRPAPVPPPLTRRAFRPCEALRHGVSRKAMRSSSYLHHPPEIYCDTALEGTDEERVQVAAARLPDGGAVAGPWGLWLLGVDVRRRDAPVDLLIPHSSSRPRRLGRAGLRITETTWLPDEHVTEVRGMPVLVPLRLAAEVARRAPDGVEAVVALDAAVAAGLVPLADVVEQVREDARRRRPGAERALARLDLVDARSESPQETRFRVGLVRRGVPRPVLQLELVDVVTGLVVYRLDLTWPDHLLAAEYDGVQHAEQLAGDNRRHNELADEGWAVRRYTSDVLTSSALDAAALDLRRLLAGRPQVPASGRGRRLRW